MLRRATPLLALLALGFAFTNILAQVAPPVPPIDDKAAPARKGAERDQPDTDRRAQPALPALKVYEWGVATMNWDGSDEGPDDVPAFYYDHTEVPIEQQPADTPNPEPAPAPKPDKPPIKVRKPVLYFECDRDLTFDLDVKFSSGTLTWMYPKPNRLTDASTVQWDNIQLFADGLPRDKFAPPSLHEVPADHWAGFSRDGSEASLVVNGEHERFLFYEGTTAGLPDADVFLNAAGELVVHNHTAHELLDLRLCVRVDGQLRRYHVASVPAASGERPGEVKLGDEHSGFSVGNLLDETAAAGLTRPQAGVFARAWEQDFAKEGTMSWRRTQAALDELMQLKLTLPAVIGSEVKRVGYVLVNNIDLARQSEIEALVVKAGDGDEAAAKQLKTLGTAGAGALGRATAGEQPLKVRLKLAKILGEMAGK